jgi:hypothetical protein
MTNRMQWIFAQGTCAAPQHLSTLGRLERRRRVRRPAARTGRMRPAMRIVMRGEDL